MTTQVKYLGNLRTESTHIKSGEKIITDAPTDNNGKGEAFSPTDMVANSAATCMLTIMGIVANRKDLNIEGATADVKKVMASEPRRISEIHIKIQMPKVGFSEEDKIILENAGMNCPVFNSIHPDIKKEIEFVW